MVTNSKKKFWLYEDFKNITGHEKYKNAKVTVKYDIKIEDFGKHTESQFKNLNKKAAMQNLLNKKFHLDKKIKLLYSTKISFLV